MGSNGRAPPPAARSTLLATRCPQRDSSAPGDVKAQVVRLFLDATEGCPDEVKRLAKKRSAGSGRQRFSQTAAALLSNDSTQEIRPSAKRFDERRRDSHLTASANPSYDHGT